MLDNELYNVIGALQVIEIQGADTEVQFPACRPRTLWAAGGDQDEKHWRYLQQNKIALSLLVTPLSEKIIIHVPLQELDHEPLRRH